MSNRSIWPIDRTLSGATTPGQSKPGSDSNERVLHIPQSSSITGTSPSGHLVSYPEHSLKRMGVLPLCRDTVGVFYSPSWLGNAVTEESSEVFCFFSPQQYVIRSYQNFRSERTFWIHQICSNHFLLFMLLSEDR